MSVKRILALTALFCFTQIASAQMFSAKSATDDREEGSPANPFQSPDDSLATESGVSETNQNNPDLMTDEQSSTMQEVASYRRLTYICIFLSLLSLVLSTLLLKAFYENKKT